MTPSIPDKRAALLREIGSLAKESTSEGSGPLFNAAQVALLFGVNERTVRIWANKDLIPAIHTPSRHWKFPALQIAQVYEKGLQQGKFQFQRPSKQVSADKESSSTTERE